MNNTELVRKLKTLVHDERRITAEVLRHLQEVEVRKIFAHMGYPSLFEFCVKELGYSEGAAQRRISAMRVIKDLPQVEEKIISGALSLSVVSQAQIFFNKKKNMKENMATGDKLDLLTSLENTSARECEKALLQLAPEMATKDRDRLLSPDTLEIKITVDREFIENLEELKNQLSHKMPMATTKDILAYALKAMVAQSALKKGPVRGAEKKMNLPPTSAMQVVKSRYISIHSKRIVWQRAGGKCQYTDPCSGRRCESKRFLEIDHVVPWASACGSNNPQNLQLLCDTHNRLKGASLIRIECGVMANTISKN